MIGLVAVLGVGQQRVARFDPHPLGALGVGQPRVVVIGQHQTQARQVHHEGIGQRLEPARIAALLRQPGLQGFGHPSGALLPVTVGHRQALRKMPVGLEFGWLALARAERAEGPLVPGRRQAVVQHARQQFCLETLGVRQLWQPVVGDHQPAHCLRQRCLGHALEGRGEQAVQSVAQQPAGREPAVQVAGLRPDQTR